MTGARMAGALSVLLLALACCSLPGVQGQGLVVGGPVGLGAGASSLSLQSAFSQSKAWKDAFKQAPRVACSRATPSLCSAAAAKDINAYARLVAAASPPDFSAADPRLTGGLDLVPAPRDQKPCASCTAFAVAAAAQAAVAAALGLNASMVEPLSVQDLMYCGSGAPTSCRAGWTLLDVLKQLKERRVAPDACLPYKAPSPQAARPPSECAAAGCAPGARAGAKGRAVARQHEVASLGTFTFQSLTAEPAIAAHIREHGAVVSRFDLMDDFEAFFKDPKNAKKVYTPKPGAKLVETHAVTVVGYNNTEQSWLCLNSWGPKFADKGLFKVAFGQCSIATPPDTYGIIWRPTFVAGRKLGDARANRKLDPAPGKPGCSVYQASRAPASPLSGLLAWAQAGDYLSAIALRFSVELNQLLLDNLGTITDLDAPLAGKEILLCGMQTALDKHIAAFKSALAKNSVGISANCFSYPNYYIVGVLDGLRELGVYTPTTKTASMGRGNGCIQCAGWTTDQALKSYDMLRSECANNNLCMGFTKEAVRKTTNVSLPTKGIAEKCRNTCYLGLSTVDLNKPHDRGIYNEVGNYFDDADFLQAWLATGYYPYAADGNQHMQFRGVPTISGYAALQSRQPPCPPGVEFCLRISCAPPPDFFPPEMSAEVALRGLNKAADRKPAYSKFSDILITESASAPEPARDAAAKAASVAALAYDPTLEELRRSGGQAVGWGIDISPNLYIPLQLDMDGCLDMAILPPDDQLAYWLTDLGRKDTKLWAKLWGVGQ
ncbi:MAG: hypothetical protein J3K34DRAFT_456134 [Monoraphidium minutum]|nr:MAG: hypothetical protein J3K34DRAFT_456134 [Monoraphidium minutum]